MLQKLRNSKISNGVRKILLILIIISFLAANSVQAVAVKVKPSEIKIEANAGVLIEHEIIIENPGENVALFEVYLDNFSDWIKAKPESFVLESGEMQKVILEIKNEEIGVFSTMISVVAKSLSERKFKANSGVKIPLEIRVIQREESNFLAAVSQNIKRFLDSRSLIFVFSIILVLVLAIICIKRRKSILKDEPR